MEGNDISYFIGSLTKYSGLVGGVGSIITLESPQSYFLAGISGLMYISGEIMQKTAKDKELNKSLEDKLKK